MIVVIIWVIRKDMDVRLRVVDVSAGFRTFFDSVSFRLLRDAAKIIQENHYYPFGQNMVGIEEKDQQSTSAQEEQKFQYNAKEKLDEFQLFWNDHGARNLDLQTGRWTSVDPLAEKFSHQSPYCGMDNNAVSLSDPTGKSGEITHHEDGSITISMHLVFYGSKAEEYAGKAMEQIKVVYKTTNVEWEGQNRTVNFNITSQIVSEAMAEELAANEGENSRAHYVRIEEEQTTDGVTDENGVTTYPSMTANDAKGMFLTTKDLNQNGTVAAHELSHLLGVMSGHAFFNATGRDTAIPGNDISKASNQTIGERELTQSGLQYMLDYARDTQKPTSSKGFAQQLKSYFSSDKTYFFGTNKPAIYNKDGSRSPI